MKKDIWLLGFDFQQSISRKRSGKQIVQPAGDSPDHVRLDDGCYGYHFCPHVEDVIFEFDADFCPECDLALKNVDIGNPDIDGVAARRFKAAQIVRRPLCHKRETLLCTR